MLPRRPAALGPCSSMRAPTSRQRVKTVVRLTWMICRCGSAFKKARSKRTCSPRSTRGWEIDGSDIFFARQHNSPGCQSYGHHVRRQAREPPRFLLRKDRPGRCRLSDSASRPQSWSLCGWYCAVRMSKKSSIRIRLTVTYSPAPGEYLRPLQPELAPWLVQSLGCHQ